ncbi:CLUMA_CG020334, isoform A [Clunio marinus]|uniref:CLUMA_CG020334, isoform A n=1 Tax=Clunio marinus TaxID=568069 RepID=A0A1J1J6E7_9DIPT|nr:CLUMA_CG020334, isoform A [Clunio marinus]
MISNCLQYPCFSPCYVPSYERFFHCRLLLHLKLARKAEDNRRIEKESLKVLMTLSKAPQGFRFKLDD